MYIESNLGFAFLLPAVTAAAKGGTVKKLLGGLFKKKKKSAAAPVKAPAKPSVIKTAAKKVAGLPKWVIPAAIGGAALILVMTMAGGGGSSRPGITVVH
jgi:hypothetical protein